MTFVRVALVLALGVSTAAADSLPPKPATAPADRIELTFTGDIMMGGTFKDHWCPQEAPADFDPLSAIKNQLAADLTVANLETTVVSKIPVDKLVGNLRFAARPDQVATLPRNGIKVVTIANNHAADLDADGIRETPGHLKDLGITAIGAPRADGPLLRIETIDVKGWKVAFIAATTRLNRPQKKTVPRVPMIDPKDLAAEVVPLVKQARADHDLVFVVLHWGVQYADNPEKWQVDAARAFIDAGANGVIGHHPHLLQRIERYKDGVIAYSLGNFMFNNALPLQRNTGVLRLGFQHQKKCLDTVVLHPAAIYPSPVHHPKPLKDGQMFEEIRDRMVKLSAPMKITVEGDRLVAPAACTK
ncbi:MAG TPA: CapA family protein [Kofleriaceae bacterium]|nr:CapA family protein [Kofleriaceae bacterium]